MEYFRIYDSAMEQLKELSAEQIGHVILAASAYSNGEELPELDAFERIVFIRLRQTIDCDAKAYNETCAKNKLNGSKGGAPKGNNNARKNNQNNRAVDLETTKTTKTTQTTQTSQYKDEYEYKDKYENKNNSLSFSPSGEVEAESVDGDIAERERIFEIFYFEKNFIEPQNELQRFYDYYTANGWCRNNSKTPIKDRIALAKQWKPQKEGARDDTELLAWIMTVYASVKAENPTEAMTIPRNIERTQVEFDNGVKNATILCDRNTATLIEQHLVPTNFKLKYRIRKTA